MGKRQENTPFAQSYDKAAQATKRQKKERWTEAQWEMIQYWSKLPRVKSDKVLTKEALERGRKRRRIERIQMSREMKLAFTEVWE